MKNLNFAICLALFLVSGCRKKVDDIQPVASFSVNNTLVEPSENVYFTNESSDADSYSWDFGDGFSSSAVDPVHYYDAEGSYTAYLTASRNNGRSDQASITIDVYYTSLEVTVAEWNTNYALTNLIPNAAVTLYLTYNDWVNLTNPVVTKYTNSAGLAVFPRVSPTTYYIDVYRTNYNNEQLGYDNIDFIRPDPLLKSHINTFTAWVDYIAKKAGNDTRTRNSVINVQEKRIFKPSEHLKNR